MPSDRALKLLEAMTRLDVGSVRLMEVCGTHTMAIARAGIKAMLPGNVKLVSGPGCPVCVTPAAVMDAVLELAMEKNVIIATYGDMIRVPGSRPGDSLQKRRAMGARVSVVYSAMDALDIAAGNPGCEVVFLGVGFETTAPGTAAAIQAASERKLSNFSVWSMLKTVEPALRALKRTDGFDISGFLCPGHVATIIGEKGFEFLPRDLGLPGVIAGFEPDDILLSVYMLLRQIANGEVKIENEYRRAVMPEGNPLAMAMIEKSFVPTSDLWRGLGRIEASGLAIRPELETFDTVKRFGVVIPPEKKIACRCGDVICGKCAPQDCPMFGKACVPEDPVGPCMVSSEGACAAAYKYQLV